MGRRCQHIKNISVKIEILNSEFAVIDYIIGNLISDSFSIDVDSDIRRTISLVLRISKEYDMLVVPRTAFGSKAHMRLSYCVETEKCEKALTVFEKLMELYK